MPADLGHGGGYDSPELVLRVWAAIDVPGLFDAELLGPGVVEQFRDLTAGQVEHIARQRGARIERTG